MDERTNIRQQLQEYILNEFLPGESPSVLTEDTPLRTSGVLDSMGTLRLITYVENHFGIEVEAHEAGVENFDRIGDMTNFILEKKGVRL